MIYFRSCVTTIDDAMMSSPRPGDLTLKVYQLLHHYGSILANVTVPLTTII